MDKKISIIGLFTVIAIIFNLGCVEEPEKEKPLEKVTLQLNWFDEIEFAGYYVAEAKGYFQYRGQYPWGPKYERQEFQIVNVVN